METNTAKMARTDQRKLPSPGIEDRLSSLPDGIIAHILSFLPTKYAVGTAVLSRRWKDLWSMVSNLDFDNTLVFEDLDSCEDVHGMSMEERREMKEMEEDRRQEFSRFVRRVLIQHRNLDSLRGFRFHFYVPELVFDSLDEDDIDQMIAYERSGGTGLPPWLRGFTLPESFYSLKNVQVVKLDGVVMAANGSVSFPSLKILELCKVEIKDFGTLSRLISGCPVLETLGLGHCTLVAKNKEDVLSASMPSLTNLTIIGIRRDDDDDDDQCLCAIEIEAPKLDDLYLENFEDLQFVGSSSSSPLPCLDSALVGASNRICLYHRLIRLLTQISNAKELHFRRSTLEFLSTGVDVQRLVFPNLTRLTVELTESWASRMLHSLLHSASKLQSLVIGMWTANDAVMWEEIEPTGTPQCLLSSLAEIKIIHLERFENEVKMVGYLLSAGAVLKKVDIDLVDNTSRGRMKARSLLKLPRVSSACDVRLTFRGSEIDVDDAGEVGSHH